MSKEIKRENSAQNLAWFILECSSRRLPYLIKNDGRHIRVGYKNGQNVDFWPSSGKWWIVGNKGKSKRDIDTLLTLLDSMLENKYDR